MNLVEQHIIKKSNKHFKELDNLCFLSKNLYNVALYEIRQHYFKNKKYLNKFELINKLTHTKQVDYKALPANVAQQTILIVDKNFKSFFKSLKSKNVKKVKIPKYLDKNGRYIAIYTKQFISKKYFKKFGLLKLVKLKDFRLKVKNVTFENLVQVRIIHKGNHIVVEIVYNYKEKPLKDDNKRYASIDLGLNNLVALSSNVINPLIIKGTPLKSINQFYNKIYAKEQSRISKYGLKTSNKIKRLTFKRNNKIKDYLHKVSHLVINHIVSNKINTLVIGHNKEWKQEITIGKRNNQNFVSIPHSTFIQMLKYKAQMEGINVIEQEESYTSKCSFLDNEEIKKHKVYKGKRIKRGLFRSSKGKIINADINASLNILRKAVPKEIKFSNGIEVCSAPSVIYC